MITFDGLLPLMGWKKNKTNSLRCQETSGQTAASAESGCIDAVLLFSFVSQQTGRDLQF